MRSGYHDAGSGAANQRRKHFAADSGLDGATATAAECQIQPKSEDHGEGERGDP